MGTASLLEEHIVPQEAQQRSGHLVTAAPLPPLPSGVSGKSALSYTAQLGVGAVEAEASLSLSELHSLRLTAGVMVFRESPSKGSVSGFWPGAATLVGGGMVEAPLCLPGGSGGMTSSQAGVALLEASEMQMCFWAPRAKDSPGFKSLSAQGLVCAHLSRGKWADPVLLRPQVGAGCSSLIRDLK